eukprot:929574-Prorocentrum_lima.AAC.1
MIVEALQRNSPFTPSGFVIDPMWMGCIAFPSVEWCTSWSTAGTQNWTSWTSSKRAKDLRDF